ncbi:uncharacterized protein LOC5507114 isoform X2 [Nematostella vectensis]|uniref:uncharacterized protein LOC5507114 isoform X2 n=1 Tax=Nematostella vectensis TaxID=45351 RepID=UPI002077925B|nr:uncharacterized protein LOC5507114 isoform X2 [Nematostella vectensis]
MIFYASLVLLLIVQQSQGILISEDCVDSLGCESHDIRDSQLNASSSLSPSIRYGPQQARLHNTNAWCAAANTADQYLEVDLGKVRMLSSILTQGDPNKNQYVKSLKLLYSVRAGYWWDYKENDAIKIFQANKDRDSVAKLLLQTETAVRYLRLMPVTWHGHVCLRLEIKGCEADRYTPLGMTNGTIPNSALTSSTMADSQGPNNARLYWLHLDDKTCWVPAVQDTSQWIKIDLGRTTLLTAVATQGCPPLDTGKSFVWTYNLMTSLDGATWTYQLNNDGTNLFKGNYNNEYEAIRDVTPEALARWVRFHPKVYNNKIAMRVELYTYGKASPGDLGIVSGEIPDTHFNASSYQCSHCQPPRGRLWFDKIAVSIYGWCVSASIQNSYLQIDLGHIMAVTGVVTQSRGKITVRWTKTYTVEYSSDGTTWTPYKDTGKADTKLFKGNTDATTAVTRYFDRVIATRMVRFFPREYQAPDTTKCMRAGVVGYKNVPVCPEGWIPFRASCFLFYFDHKSTIDSDEARTACRARDANLADIRDIQEHLFMNTRIEHRAGHVPYVIGLIKRNNRWEWEVDGSAASWIPWADGQPQERVDEICARNNIGEIHDHYCSDRYTTAAICKKPATGGFFGTPVIFSPLPDVDAYENETITLQCQAIGDAVIIIAWLHNDTLVQNRSVNTALVISNIPLNMSGSWRCVASNHLGSQNKTFYVDVKSTRQRLLLKVIPS